MMQRLRKKISYIQRTTKKWLSFIAVNLILSSIIYVLFFNRIIESQNVLSVLDTLAQSNATILAIVISLSLVVIEFSASRYSARVVDFIKNDSILWEFLLLYFFSIFYPLLLITLITKETNDFLLHIYFSTAYALSIFAYFSLFYYIRYIFKMMKSSSVIDILSEKIDIKSLSKSWNHLDEDPFDYSEKEPRITRINIFINDETDPLLPIIEIINASIERCDYATANYGLSVILRRFLFNLKQNPLYEKQISEHLFYRILDIWQLSLNKNNLNFIQMMYIYYYRIGKQCTFFWGNSSSSYIVSIIKNVSKALTPVYNTLNTTKVEEEIKQTDLLYTTFLAEYFQKEAFKSIIKIKEDDFSELQINSIKYLRLCGIFTFNNHGKSKTNEQIEALEKSITEFSEILGEVGIAAINADSKNAVDEVISVLDEIGEATIDHNLIHSIFHIVKIVNKIGEESAKKGMEFESSTKQTVVCLEKLASKISTHSEELAGEAQNQVIEYHKYIKLKYKHKRTENALEELNDRVECLIRAYISSYVYTIARESVKNDLLDATRQCLISLAIIERILKDDSQSRNISENIKSLGLDAVKKEQTFPLMEDIIQSLYSIVILQFGYMFDWNSDLGKRQEFLKKEYSCYLARGLQSSYSNFLNAVDFKDMGDSNYTVYPDDMIYGEQTLIIGGEERKDLKGLYLKDIDDGYRTTKIFKVNDFKDSGKAYYRIPELLKELTDPIIEHVLNSLSDEALKPFTMIINCFENFGITSIHFRDEFSLNRIFIRSLIAIGDSFNDYKYLKYNEAEYNEDNKAWEYLDLMTEAVSDSIYKLAIESLTYNFVDFSILNQQMECLIRIHRKYHNIFWVVAKFERILEMIKECKLKESEGEKTESERKKIIIIIENAIQEFRSNNANE